VAGTLRPSSQAGDFHDGSGRGSLTIHPAHDDATRDSDLVFAIWLQEDGGAIDYERAPSSWVLPEAIGSQLRLTLDGGGVCKPGGNFPTPFRGARVRIGVRALDLSGKASAPSEAFVRGITNAYSLKLAGALAAPADGSLQLLAAAAPSSSSGIQRRHLLGALAALLLALALALTVALARQRSA
jgi:hypothetical protein